MAIVRLPGSKLTPEVLLHQLLEDDDVKGVFVVVLDKDDCMYATWSNMKTSMLAMAAIVTQQKVTEAVMNPDRTPDA
jgi:hypothetical protein